MEITGVRFDTLTDIYETIVAVVADKHKELRDDCIESENIVEALLDNAYDMVDGVLGGYYHYDIVTIWILLGLPNNCCCVYPNESIMANITSAVHDEIYKMVYDEIVDCKYSDKLELMY